MDNTTLKMPPKDYILPLPKPKMTKKTLNISEEAAVQMPMETVASLILLVAAGVFAYTELTARLVSLETSRELFEADLLKKSEQLPTDQEQYMLLEAVLLLVRGQLFTFLCLLYTSPSPRDGLLSRMPSSA